MKDFLKRKFLSILNLFLVCPLGKKQRKERAKETNNTEKIEDDRKEQSGEAKIREKQRRI